MKRVVFFVDGFNLYHSIAQFPDLNACKWLNIRALAQMFVKQDDVITSIMYFTAFATWKPASANRHRELVKIYRDLGLTVVEGKFIEKEVRCNSCASTWVSHEEKRTDVSIGIELLDRANRDLYDTAYLVTGDGDFVPAIERVKKNHPNKEIRVLVPVGRFDSELLKACGGEQFRSRIKKRHLLGSILPDPYTMKNGNIISCPPTWK